MEPDAKYKLIPFIINEFESWDPGLQETIASNLPRVLGTLSKDFVRSVFYSCLRQVRDTQDPMWMTLLGKCCKHASAQRIEKHVVPIILEFGEYDNEFT